MERALKIVGALLGVGVIANVAANIIQSLQPREKIITKEIIREFTIPSYYDYFVFKDDNVVRARDERTGEIKYSEAYAKTILESILLDGNVKTVYIKDGVDLPLVELNPRGRLLLEQGIELYGLGYKPSITDPTSLTFKLKKVYDIMNKLKPIQLLYENNFNGRLFNYQGVFNAGDIMLSIEDGKLKYTGSTSTVVAIKDYKVKYPSIVLITKVDSLDDTGRLRLGVGDLTYSNYILAIYYGPQAGDYQNTLRFEIRKDGGSYTGIASTSLTLTFPTYLMLVITGTQMSFFYSHDGENWTHVLDGDFSSYLQLQNEGTLSMLYPYLGVDGGTATFDFIKIYHALPIGIADMNPVTYEDGNPIIIDNKLYFAGSLRGIGSGSFETHTAIFTLDLNTFDIDLVSVIYSREYLSSISGYAIFFDHATHVMYDRRTKTFRVLFSAWDDAISRNRVCVKIAETKQDILNSGIHVLDIVSDTFSLNSTIGTHYDPFCWYDYDAGKYYIEVAKGDGWTPVLIETTDFQNFSIVAQAAVTGSEGGNLFKIGGKQYIIAGQHHIYSKDDLSYLGQLSISEDLGGSPWGFIVPKYENGKSRYLYVVFNDADNIYGINWSYGRVYIYESEETEEGYPYWLTKEKL